MIANVIQAEDKDDALAAIEKFVNLSPAKQQIILYVLKGIQLSEMIEHDTDKKNEATCTK